MTKPKGISVMSESQGEKPAFLQMNQNGITVKTNNSDPMIRMMISS